MRKQSTMIWGVILLSCLLPLMAVASIQEQIDAAVDGDIILIEPGTYVENINFNGKNIEVHSMGGPEVTIIDGNQNGSCVQIVNGEDSTAVLDGFTLTNGSGYQGLTVWIGGGLVVTNGSHPTLLNLIITGNTSTHGAGDVGGGLSIGGNSNPYLEGIIVSDNVSEYGGGISIYASNPTLHDVVISNNHANIGGGGIAIGLASNPLLSSILIFGNTGTYSSGGIFVTENATPIFNQVIVVDNIAPLGGGGMLASLNANPMFVNSIFWGNIPDQIYLYDEGVEDANTMTVAYSDIQGGAAGITLGHGSLNWEAGNIDADPLFIDPDSDAYCLSEDSPCNDAGTALWSYNSQTIIDMSETEYYGSAPDMGACESIPSPTVIEVPGDHATIQAAIEVAHDLDTIRVSAGTYVENLEYSGKNIVITSVAGPDETIIDGNQNGSVVIFAGGENENAILDGFTITNGSGSIGLTAWIGGGIMVRNSSHPTLMNLIVTGNTSLNGTNAGGGGINISTFSTPHLENIVVSGNTSAWGGGISIYEASPTLHDVVISNNHATSAGGGLNIDYAAHPELNSVLVSGNTATSSAGGMFVHSNASPIFNHITVVENIGPYGGGGMLASNNANPVINNSIFWGNIPDQIYLYDDAIDLPNTLTVAYSDIHNGAAGITVGEGTLNWEAGNIDANPWFCDPEAHIYTLAENSPCVGSGEEGVNMGALGVGCATPVAINADPALPDQFALYQNYPNPFNPSTTISFDLPSAGWVNLVVYDLLGRELVRVIDGAQPAGYNTIRWHALDSRGHALDAGIYLYWIQVTTDSGTEFSSVRKLSLVK